MVSDMDEEFEALFARIQSHETAKRFKLLRFATVDDLVRTFRSERPGLPKREERSGFQSDSKPQTR